MRDYLEANCKNLVNRRKDRYWGDHCATARNGTKPTHPKPETVPEP